MPVPPCIVSRVMADIVLRGLLDVLRSRLRPARRGRGLTQRGRRLALRGVSAAWAWRTPRFAGKSRRLESDVSALAVERGDNETKAATPSAMAETRRAPCVMATSLQMSGAARRRTPPSPAVTLKTRKPTGGSLKSAVGSQARTEIRAVHRRADSADAYGLQGFSSLSGCAWRGITTANSTKLLRSGSAKTGRPKEPPG